MLQIQRTLVSTQLFLESELIQNERKRVFLYALQHFIPRKQQMYDLEI